MKVFGNKSDKPKFEFSQRMCVWSFKLLVFSVVFGLSAEFALQWFGKGSMTAIVEIVLGVISFMTVFINGGYITQNVFRNLSLNKHGLRIPKDGSGKYYLPKPEQVTINENIDIEEEQNEN